jgi:hypothetical protein
LRDPEFADHAAELLRSWRNSTSESGKGVAAVLRLVKLLPEAPDSLTAAASAPNLGNLPTDERESPGDIAEEWLRNLREKLMDLAAK